MRRHVSSGSPHVEGIHTADDDDFDGRTGVLESDGAWFGLDQR
jgi:hypothetical protein